MERESFRSRLGFLLVSAGCAIGIGNVWRFPYIAGKNGGGYFVLFYLICLLVMGVPVLTMERAVRAAVGPMLEKIVLFDVYKGSHIPAGKKSVAFNLVLRRADRTITDEESESAVQKAVAALAELGAELRS